MDSTLPTLLSPSEKAIQTACQRWASGNLVAIPTETVYGLAADATQPEAVTKIFALKGRPVNHPLIVHIGHFDQLTHVATHVPEPLQQLAKTFWPGPLTIVVEKSDQIPDCVTGGQPTVAVRMPSHPIALSLLQAYGKPLAAPSANRYQHISPTTANHVVSEFPDTDLLVIDGGPCTVGLESTIVGWDENEQSVTLLRPGHISQKQLAEVSGCSVVSPNNPEAASVPGNVATHYAPRTPAYFLGQQPPSLSLSQTVVIGLEGEPLPQTSHIITLPNDSISYGQKLYAALRQADNHCQENNLAAILIQPPPQGPPWAAIWDRLQRATR